MSRRGFSNVLIGFIIALIAAAAAAYVVLTQRPVAPRPPLLPPDASIPTSPASQSGTANWKTYRSEVYGFEFRYPDDAQVGESGIMVFGTQPPTIVERILLKKNYIPFSPFLVFCYIGPCEYENYGFEVTIPRNEVVVTGDYDWSERSCPIRPSDRVERAIFGGYKTLIGPRSYCVNFPPNPLVISFAEKIRPTAERILSTFRFINEDSASWKTYRNERMGVEIKYPPDLLKVEEAIRQANSPDWPYPSDNLYVSWENPSEKLTFQVNPAPKGQETFRKYANGSLLLGENLIPVELSSDLYPTLRFSVVIFYPNPQHYERVFTVTFQCKSTCSQTEARSTFETILSSFRLRKSVR